MSNFLSDFSKALDEQTAREVAERKEFNLRLGEPAVFAPANDDPRFGIGYWKANGGVIAFRKYANGYDPYSRMEYSTELIAILNKVA